jgi:pimeloyl-ACP methyl ester carboxylesterase
MLTSVRYWDFSFDHFNYSYVNVATNDFGYCTLAYDRLGIGNSSHGEPKNEIQSFLEEAALHEMVTMLRNGTFPNVKHAFDKVVGVGHSFGSAQTYQDANNHPSDFDAIVLTGFTMNGSFVGLFVAGANFIQANLNTDENLMAYPNGYLVSSDIGAQEYLFFTPYHFDYAVLQAAEATKEPVTVGEALSLGSLVASNAYAGHVFVIDGDGDLPYCGGDCVNTGNPALPNIGAAVSKNFPMASSFESYTQPNTGHGLNLHYNSTAGYVVVQNWLASVGLKA